MTMELYNKTINHANYTFDTIIDTDIVKFNFYDTQRYNMYSIELNEELIMQKYSLSSSNFCKVVKHCLNESPILNYSMVNTQIHITFTFSEIIDISFTLELNLVILKSVESSKKAIKHIDEKIIALKQTFDDYNECRLVSIGTIVMIFSNHNNYTPHMNGTQLNRLQTEYLLYMKNKSLKIKVSENTNTSLMPLYDDAENPEFDNQIQCKTVTFRQSFKTILCHYMKLDTLSLNLLSVLPKSIKTIEVTNDIVFQMILLNIGKINKSILPNLEELILHNVVCKTNANNLLFLKTSLRQISVYGSSSFSNYECLDGKITVIIN
jgi:hypothetical protein